MYVPASESLFRDWYKCMMERWACKFLKQQQVYFDNLIRIEQLWNVAAEKLISSSRERDIVLATVRCCVHLEERLLWQAVFSYAWHVTHGTRQRQRHYSLHTYFFVYVQLATTSDKSPASCRPRHVVSGGATFAKLHDIVTSFTLNIGL